MALVYLVGAPLYLPSIHNQWGVLAVESLAWIFW